MILSRLDYTTAQADMQIYAVWNNKGGTGKTSIAFQAICRYAERHPTKRILAVDVCPQANLSELFLGGLTNGGSNKLLLRHAQPHRCSIGGYFQLRFPSPWAIPTFVSEDFLTKPSQLNATIPPNIDLVCGDPLLELQANAMNTFANTQNPAINTWVLVIDWLRDYLNNLKQPYDTVFIDSNPSFSIYTQIALAAADRLILPVMADDSSRRAIQNVFSLIYGLKLPSALYASYAFKTKLEAEKHKLPVVHLVVKNRITQYMGAASAYRAVLGTIDTELKQLVKLHPGLFTFTDVKKGLAEVRDFQTTGVVAYARGCPFYCMPTGRLDVGGLRIRVDEDNKQNCVKAIDSVVDHL